LREIDILCYQILSNMKKIRTIVIAVGVTILFILAAALAIIIARGGIIGGNGGIIETGIIRVSSKPEDVKVFVDGEARTLQDKQISGLEEKEYKITLAKDGYSSWEKTIKARPGIVIELFAQLFPTELNLTEITKTNIDKAFYSRDGQYVVYVVKSSEIGSDLGIWKLKLTVPTITILQNRPEKISNITTTLTSIVNSNYTIDFSPDNRYLKIRNLDTDSYYILNSEIYNEISTPINTDLGYTPDRVEWFDNSSTLVVSKDNTLFEYDLNQKTSKLIALTPGGKPVFGLNKDKVIFYDSNHKRFEVYQAGKSQELKVENISLPDNVQELYVSELEQSLVIFKTDKGFFYLNTEKSFLNKIGDNLTMLEFSRDGKVALFTDGKDLLSYTIEEFIAQNRFEAKINKIIEGYDASVNFARISSDSQHNVLFSTKDGKRIVEVCDRDGDNLVRLIDDERIAGFSLSIPVDSSSFFLLLNDEIRQNGETQVLRTNLYELDLKEPRK